MSTQRRGLTAAIKALPRPIWILFGGTFINRFGSFVGVFIVLYLTRKGYSVPQAGLALAAFGLGSLPGSALGGYLADRVGRRETLVLATFVNAAATWDWRWYRATLDPGPDGDRGDLLPGSAGAGRSHDRGPGSRRAPARFHGADALLRQCRFRRRPGGGRSPGRSIVPAALWRRRHHLGHLRSHRPRRPPGRDTARGPARTPRRGYARDLGRPRLPGLPARQRACLGRLPPGQFDLSLVGQSQR